VILALVASAVAVPPAGASPAASPLAVPAQTALGPTPLADLFAGRTQLVEDTRFRVDDPSAFRDGAGRPGHSETATVTFGGVHRMYYRTFIRPNGSRTSNGVPAGIAMATSTDGHSWRVHDGGRPVVPSRTVEQVPGCVPAPCVIAVYAPSVILDGGGLTLALEVMDTRVSGAAASPRHWIEVSTSADGVTWSPPVRALEAAEPWEGFDGRHRGNVGTPQITKDGAAYRVDYHGFSADNRQMARGFASGTDLTALTRAAANPTFRPAPGWNSFGPGNAATIVEAGVWYRVFEGFSGSAHCGRTDTVVSWGLARSTDGVTWEQSVVNPVRTGRIRASCGEDMPSWQVLPGEAPMVMVTNYNHPHPSEASVKRYRIEARPTVTTATEVAALTLSARDDGYWLLSRDGRVHAFGTAAHHGHASAPPEVRFVDIAARPDGRGYWAVASDGTVRALGAAVHHGDGVRGTVAVASSPSGGGYWVVSRDGRVRAFGDAVAHGSVPTPPVAAIVDIAVTPRGDGYWLVGTDGGVHTFGRAPFHGSLPGRGIDRGDVVGIAGRPDGAGYWIVAGRGDVWEVNAPDHGSTGGWLPFSARRIVGMGPRAIGQGAGDGFFLVAADGGVVDLGLAVYNGHVRGPGWRDRFTGGASR
jgi:hypothetical protein